MNFRRLCSLSLSLSALLLCSTQALAGVANTFNVTVTPNAVKTGDVYNATYTEPGVDMTNLADVKENGYFVSYTVSVKNDGKNTANDVVFVGKAFATDGAEQAVFIHASNQNCVPSTAVESGVKKVIVTCSFGQMKAKTAIAPFVVTFATPQKVVGGNNVGDGAGTDKLSFDSVTYYAEGANDIPTNLPNSTKVANADPVVLGTATSNTVRSFLLENEAAVVRDRSDRSRRHPRSDQDEGARPGEVWLVHHRDRRAGDAQERQGLRQLQSLLRHDDDDAGLRFVVDSRPFSHLRDQCRQGGFQEQLQAAPHDGLRGHGASRQLRGSN